MCYQFDPEARYHKVEQRIGKRLSVDPDGKRSQDNYFAPDSERWWRKGQRPKRDSYRERVYRAESRFCSKIEQRKFANSAEVAKYVRDFMEKPWFQRRFPRFRECSVSYIAGSRCCRGGCREWDPFGHGEVTKGFIKMSSWGMGLSGRNGGEIVVLHELAHAVLPYGHHHDRRWARTFLEFVGSAVGQPQRRILMQAFRDERVPFSPVKKTQPTERQLELLAAARPNRAGGGA